MGRFLLLITSFMWNCQVFTKEPDWGQKFIENVINQTNQQIPDGEYHRYLQKGLTQSQINDLKIDVTAGGAKCLLYSLLAQPKEVGHAMIMDVANGVPLIEARTKSEKAWIELAKRDGLTKDDIFEVVERTEEIYGVCRKHVRAQITMDYKITP